MDWLHIILIVDQDYAEDCSDALVNIGAVSVSFQDNEDQPIYEPELGTTELWKSTKVIGLFKGEQNITLLKAKLYGNLDKNRINNLETEILEDKDWTRAWMDNFKPMHFGNNLWIIPSGYEPVCLDAININLDPGLAFGTGTHPTTAMCLKWLGNNPPINMNVIDYGTGSGILAIAALKLNAKYVTGVDIDPQAITAFYDNVLKNNLNPNSYKAVLPEDLDKNLKADLLIANILKGPLQSLCDNFKKLLKPNGKILLSGILKTQEQDIIDTYSTHFKNFIVDTDDEWACISAIAK